MGDEQEMKRDYKGPIPIQDMAHFESGKSFVEEADIRNALEFIDGILEKTSYGLYSQLIEYVQISEMQRVPLAKRMKLQDRVIENLYNSACLAWEASRIAIDYIDGFRGSKPNARKRWSKEEDDLLIDLVVQGESEVVISTTLGRSVSACKTRCSTLVGIGRTTVEVAGYFIGQLNGENVDGMIHGHVLPEKR